jgi:hypothetical protein
MRFFPKMSFETITPVLSSGPGPPVCIYLAVSMVLCSMMFSYIPLVSVLVIFLKYSSGLVLFTCSDVKFGSLGIYHHSILAVKLKLFCPEAKNSSLLFKFLELWGADLLLYFEWGAILLEVNFYHSFSSQLRVLTISYIHIYIQSM